MGLLIVTGLVAGVRAKIGYSQPGTPLYRQSAKVNRDIVAVRRVFPIDEGWVIIRARQDANDHFQRSGRHSFAGSDSPCSAIS